MVDIHAAAEAEPVDGSMGTMKIIGVFFASVILLVACIVWASVLHVFDGLRPKEQ
jgi:hypothetical protein